MSIVVSIIIGALLMGAFIFIAFILFIKQQSFANSLKPGDRISFYGCPGKFVGYSRGKMLIEIEVSEMLISKPIKNENLSS